MIFPWQDDLLVIHRLFDEMKYMALSLPCTYPQTGCSSSPFNGGEDVLINILHFFDTGLPHRGSDLNPVPTK